MLCILLILRTTFLKFVSSFWSNEMYACICKFEDMSNVYLILKRNLNLVLCKCIDINSLTCKYLFELLPKIKKKFVAYSMYNITRDMYAKCNNAFCVAYWCICDHYTKALFIQSFVLNILLNRMMYQIIRYKS